MATVRELAIRVTGDSSSYSREMNRAANTGTQFYRTMEERARRFDTYIANNNRSIEAINNKLTSLGKTALTAMTALGGGIAVSGLVKMADDYGQMAIRVKMALESVTGDTEQFKSVQDRLFEMSNRNSKAIEQAQTLYIQTAKGMGELGLSTSQTVDVIETLNNEFTINATNAQATESAINAFSKALLKGKVGSDELMSIMSAMPSLMGDVASSMGLSETALKQMVLNNKIPLSELLQKIGEIKDKTSEMANSMQNTVADGFVQVSNAIKKYVGDVNEANEITANMSAGLRVIADNFDLVANTAITLTGIGLARYFGNTTQSLYLSVTASIKKIQTDRIAIIAEKERITSQLAVIATEKAQLDVKKQNILLAQANTASIRAQTSLNQQLIAVEAQLTAAKNAETAATSRLTAANKSLNLVSRAGSGLLGVMGGPVGLIATVGVLAASFIDFSGKADDATASLVAQGGSIDELIQKYSELGKAQQTAEKTRVESESNNLVDSIKSRLDDLYNEVENSSGRTVFNSLSGANENFKSLEDYKNLDRIKSIEQEIVSLAQAKNLSYDDLNAKVQSIYDIALNDLNVAQTAFSVITSKGDVLIENGKQLNKNAEYQDKINNLQVDAQKQAEELAKQEAERQKLTEKATGEYENQLNILNKMLEQYNKVDALSSAKNFMSGTSSAYLSGDQKKALQSKLDEIEIAKKADEQAKEAEKKRLEALKASEELKRESERQREQAQTKYNEVVNSLRTTEQKQFDEYKEKYDLIQKMAKSESERNANTQKLAEQTVNQPVGSASSVLLNSLTPMQRADYDEESEIDKLNSWHQLVQEIYADNQEKLLEQQQAYEDAKTAIQQEFTEKRQKILNDEVNAQLESTSNLLTSASNMFGGIADIIGKFSNDSGAAYKAMFALSKGFAIADAALKLQSALMQAMADPTALTPAQKFANYAAVAAAGGSLLSSISSVALTGMAHDGIDSVPKEGTWLLDKGERVVDARTNADLKTFLTAKNEGSNKSGDIIINNYGNDEVSVNQVDNQTIIEIAAKKGAERGYQMVSESISSHSGSVWSSLIQNTNTKAKL